MQIILTHSEYFFPLYGFYYFSRRTGCHSLCPGSGSQA